MILVDSSVLIDVIDEDRHWCGWSLAALDEWSRRGPVLINPVIYAEISPDFDHPAALDAVLEKVGIAYREISREALFLAAKAHQAYRAGAGKGPACCRTFLSVPTRAVLGAQLLTRRCASLSKLFSERSAGNAITRVRGLAKTRVPRNDSRPKPLMQRNAHKGLPPYRPSITASSLLAGSGHRLNG